MRGKIFIMMVVIAVIIKGIFSLEIYAKNEIIAKPNSTYPLKIFLSNDLYAKEVNISVIGIESLYNKKRIYLNSFESREIIIPLKIGDIGIYNAEIVVKYGNNSRNKKILIKSSSIVEKMRDLIDYYKDLLGIVRGRVETRKVLEIERLIDESEKMYLNEEYSDLEKKLEEIRLKFDEIENSFYLKREIGRNESYDTGEISQVNVEVFLYPVLAILIILILVLETGKVMGKKFIVKSIKSNRRDLKNLGKVVRIKGNEKLWGEIMKLQKEMEEMNAEKDLFDDLEIVKNKYRQGMFLLCKIYLDDLKKRVKGG